MVLLVFNNTLNWGIQASHFEMEKPGKPSRWNTLRAIRVLRHYDIN